MGHGVVLARDFQGRPLVRVAVGRVGGLIYLINPDRISEFGPSPADGVGFPAEDVFEFDEITFKTLSAQWEADSKMARDSWLKLRRYRADAEHE